MKKSFCTIILLITLLYVPLILSAKISGVQYPQIQQSGNTLADFTPKGWMVLDTAIGDLNKDGAQDMAFVLQAKDSVTFTKRFTTDTTNVDTVRAQPRILVITFFNKETKRFQLIEFSNTFILMHDNPYMDEPFDDITINNGILKLDFHIWYSMGTWSTIESSYKFRYEGTVFSLIGADYSYLLRNTGDIDERSYNFITKKIQIKTTKGSSGKTKTSWKTLQLTTLKTFKTFTEPYSWEIEKDIMI
ncbi:MAG: hypothetical protein K1X91_00430 [Bacteriodetes bacterium]|nr:hypothetical protein [Bacteroidota bacterium]